MRCLVLSLACLLIAGGGLRLFGQETITTPVSPSATEPGPYDNSPVFVEEPEFQPYVDTVMYLGVELQEVIETPMGVRLYADPDGLFYSSSADQLPPAADANDFHNNPLHAPPGLSMASQSRLLHFLTTPWGAPYDANAPRQSFGLQARPGLFYDTGAFEGGSTAFRPGTIALDNTDAARTRGRTYFNEFPDTLESLPARMQYNIAFDDTYGVDHAQAYVDAVHLNDNSLRGRSFFLRGYVGDDGILIGKAETTFGDIGSAPMLIATGALPIGSVGIIDEGENASTSVPQIRFTQHWYNDRLESTVAIEENSSIADIDYGGQVEHIWPSFVGRIRLKGDDDFNSCQLAGMARPIGINDPTFIDHSVTAWGISLIGRFCNQARTDALYFGVVGGEGIGGYIYGDIRAAIVPTPTTITKLDNFGTYVAYQHVWSPQDTTMAATRNLSSNVAYGYVSSETFAPTDNRHLHQAWCNLLWNATDTAAFGIECQYGEREIADGNQGDNFRIMFVAQISAPTSKALNAQQSLSRREETSQKQLQTRRL
jgi:hypothetical protein